MLSHSKKQRSLAQLQGEPVYGSYDRYNFFKVYQKHNPLHVRVSKLKDYKSCQKSTS